MILWRISDYAVLDGAGGLAYGGRWHSPRQRIVYLAPNPAAALLERLVHIYADADDVPASYALHKIDAPPALHIERIDEARLPADWRNNLDATRQIGDAWLASRRTPLLEVPSALVPETWNVLMNPDMPESNGARIAAAYRAILDPRLS